MFKSISYTCPISTDQSEGRLYDLGKVLGQHHFLQCDSNMEWTALRIEFLGSSSMITALKAKAHSV